MKWYPWLNYAYQQIIHLHQKKYSHHALLLHADNGMGGNSLIYAISRWLMCKNHDTIKSCGSCHDCKLMLAETHPDLHKIIVDNDKNIIGVDHIRYLTDILTNHAQQNKIKVIWFPCIEKLTEAAINALLKTLEEPTNDTFFLLECQNISVLPTTLISRCFYFYLKTPNFQTTLNWLKIHQINQPLINIEIAIKINFGIPLNALILLEPSNWFKRKIFFKSLMQHLIKKTLFNWLEELDKTDVIIRLNWLITILLDAIKYQDFNDLYCMNKDQLKLIINLSNNYSSKILFKSINDWQKCRYQLISIIGLNQTLCLLTQLINWQNLLNMKSL